MRRNEQIVYYICQQPGHISQGCRNQRVRGEVRRENASKTVKEEAGKQNRDTRVEKQN